MGVEIPGEDTKRLAGLGFLSVGKGDLADVTAPWGWAVLPAMLFPRGLKEYRLDG
jgi:hypothetical protein